MSKVSSYNELSNFPLLVVANSWAGRLFINLTFDKTTIRRIRAERIAARMTQRLLETKHGR